jgi:hypothetical protein
VPWYVSSGKEVAGREGEVVAAVAAHVAGTRTASAAASVSVGSAFAVPPAATGGSVLPGVNVAVTATAEHASSTRTRRVSVASDAATSGISTVSVAGERARRLRIAF